MKPKKIEKQTMSVVAVDEETKTALETQLKADMDLAANLLAMSEGLELNSDLGGFVIPQEWVEGANELAASTATIATQVTGTPDAAAEVPAAEEVEEQADDPEEEEVGGDTGLDSEDTLFEDEEVIEESGHLDEEDEKVAKLAKRVMMIGKNQHSQLKAMNEMSRVLKGISERLGVTEVETPAGTERVPNGSTGRPVISLLKGKLPIDVDPHDLLDPSERRAAIQKRVTEFTQDLGDEDNAAAESGSGRVVSIPDTD